MIQLCIYTSFFIFFSVMVYHQVLNIVSCAIQCVHVCSVAKLCLTLRDPMDCQGPLSMGFPRQEYWNRLPFSPPGELPTPEIEPFLSCVSCISKRILYHWATWKIVLFGPSIWFLLTHLSLHELVRSLKGKTDFPWVHVPLFLATLVYIEMIKLAIGGGTFHPLQWSL